MYLRASGTKGPTIYVRGMPLTYCRARQNYGTPSADVILFPVCGRVMRFGTGSGATRAGKNDFGFEEVAVCRY